MQGNSTDSHLACLLDELLLGGENEVVELKHAKADFPTDKVGQYFSALANQANLLGLEQAWLVFGIDDKSRTVVGTGYRIGTDRLQHTKMQMAQGTEPSITFKGIYEYQHPQGRVVFFKIPPAPRGLPIAWKGHYYARAGENLTPMGIDKLDEIRGQSFSEDWTAQIVHGASTRDLDEQALSRARQAFQMKYAQRFSESEVAQWDASVFLNRARITVDGQITRAAMLLLGRSEASWQLSPHPAELTWNLRGQERAYEHFYPPFLISTSNLYQRIRNIQIRLLPRNQLLPIEISKYEEKIVMEALHNCIAHQDYNRNSRIIVTEHLDCLTFENQGGFFEDAPEDYIEGTKVPSQYRNPFLAQAMTALNMIDTMGLGIHDIHTRQAKRYSPLPDYDLSQPEAVRTTIYGTVADSAYAHLLMQNKGIPLSDIILLDRVQKRLSVPKAEASRLRLQGMIKGRNPNLRLSLEPIIAETKNLKNESRNENMPDLDRILLEHLRNVEECSRAEINSILIPHFSEGVSDDKKSLYINNLLTRLQRYKAIKSNGRTRAARWSLAENEENESA